MAEHTNTGSLPSRQRLCGTGRPVEPGTSPNCARSLPMAGSSNFSAPMQPGWPCGRPEAPVEQIGNRSRFEPVSQIRPRGVFDRGAIEREIERLIALLDAFDGDCDLEPSIIGGMDSAGRDITDDREGGDVLDEPHDDEAGEEDFRDFPAYEHLIGVLGQSFVVIHASGIRPLVRS